MLNKRRKDLIKEIANMEYFHDQREALIWRQGGWYKLENQKGKCWIKFPRHWNGN